MRKMIMSAALVAVMFGFTGCDTKPPMSAQERADFEQTIKFAKKDTIKREYMIAYANSNSEKLAYFTNEVLLPGDKFAVEAEWQQQKEQLDKALLDMQKTPPTKAEIKAVIAQLESSPEFAKFDYIKNIVLPELKNFVKEDKK